MSAPSKVSITSRGKIVDLKPVLQGVLSVNDLGFSGQCPSLIPGSAIAAASAATDHTDHSSSHGKC